MSAARIYMTLVCVSIITGCSSKGSSSSSDSNSTGGVSGVVTAGPAVGTTVSAYLLKSDGSLGAKLATTTTDANGNFSFMMVAQKSPVEFIAGGGSYNEEATGNTVNMGVAQMRTMLPTLAVGQHVALTPVTEISAQNALAAISANPTLTTAAIISSSNSSIATALGLSDITTPPANPFLAASLASSQSAAQYALVLAAISQIAHTASTAAGTTINSLDVAQALASSFTYNGSFLPTVGSGAAQLVVPVPNRLGNSLTLANVWNAVNSSADFASAMQNAVTIYNNGMGSTLGYGNTTFVPAMTFVAAPAVSTGMANLTLPATPNSLPQAEPTTAGPPPLPGQVASAAPTAAFGASQPLITLGYAARLVPTMMMTNGAAISSCTVTPALPAGLSVDPQSCIISGTPSVTSTSTQYTMAITNSVGTTNISLTMAVAPVIPHIYISDATGGEMSCAMNANGTIGTCASHVSLSSTSYQVATSYVVNQPNLYIAAGSAINNCTVAMATGATTCATGGVAMNNVKSVTARTTLQGLPMIYAVDDNGMNLCTTDASTGAINGCTLNNSGMTVPNNWKPVALDFYTVSGGNIYAYVLDNRTTGTMYVCGVNPTSNLLACTLNPPSGLPTTAWSPNQITIKTINGNTYGYIAAGLGNIYKCPINNTTGVISNCVVSNGGVATGTATSKAWTPTSISFSNLGGSTTYAYVTDQRSNQVVLCGVSSSDGSLTNCGVSLASGLQIPAGALAF